MIELFFLARGVATALLGSALPESQHTLLDRTQDDVCVRSQLRFRTGSVHGGIWEAQQKPFWPSRNWSELDCSLFSATNGTTAQPSKPYTQRVQHEYEYCDVCVNRSDDNMPEDNFQVSQRLTSDLTTTPQQCNKEIDN